MALAISVMVVLKGILTGNIKYADLIPFILIFLVAGVFFIFVMKAKTTVSG